MAAKSRSAFPLNAETILNYDMEAESLEDGLARLKALKCELFDEQPSAKKK